MIGTVVASANTPSIVGGVVEEQHKFFDALWAIRALDGLLYWHWSADFTTA